MCGKIRFHNDSPMLKYCQKWLDIFCSSILASACDSIEKTKSANATSLRIEEYLKIEKDNCIDFENAV